MNSWTHNMYSCTSTVHVPCCIPTVPLPSFRFFHLSIFSSSPLADLAPRAHHIASRNRIAFLSTKEMDGSRFDLTLSSEGSRCVCDPRARRLVAWRLDLFSFSFSTSLCVHAPFCWHEPLLRACPFFFFFSPVEMEAKANHGQTTNNEQFFLWAA